MDAILKCCKQNKKRNKVEMIKVIFFTEISTKYINTYECKNRSVYMSDWAKDKAVLDCEAAHRRSVEVRVFEALLLACDWFVSPTTYQSRPFLLVIGSIFIFLLH